METLTYYYTTSRGQVIETLDFKNKYQSIMIDGVERGCQEFHPMLAEIKLLHESVNLERELKKRNITFFKI